mgnify:CR=1 FL=1
MTYVESNVKELPEKGAKIVAQLKENIEATIIENTNYYYKVTFTDEDGVQREGYVAKRNLKIIKEPEAEETEEKLPPVSGSSLSMESAKTSKIDRIEE